MIPLFVNGPPEKKLDLLVISEGYTAAERDKFVADATRLTDFLFGKYEPFRSRKGDFNVRLLHLPSAESGVTRPFSGLFRRTPLSAQYGIFGSERYVLTLDDRALREAASAAPYDVVEVLVNDARYGGGGIFGSHATAAAGSAWAEYLFVHEFGHHIAGLADEYYTSDVAYETGGAEHVEPWEPNVTALKGPEKSVKWADLVTAGTPLPTPWEKEDFEKESRAFQVRTEEAGGRRGRLPKRWMRSSAASRPAETKLLSGMRYSGKVGAFEGASYDAKGLLPPRRRLHHVHAGRRRLLPGLPSGHREGHRPRESLRTETRSALTPPRPRPLRRRRGTSPRRRRGCSSRPRRAGNGTSSRSP